MSVVPQLPADADQLTKFEGDIRGVVRRLREQDTAAVPAAVQSIPAAVQSAENANAVIQRVASVSIEEIERVIAELEGVRETLRSEGDRVSRELAGYVSLNQTSTTAMKVISDTVKQWIGATFKNSQAFRR